MGVFSGNKIFLPPFYSILVVEVEMHGYAYHIIANNELRKECFMILP